MRYYAILTETEGIIKTVASSAKKATPFFKERGYNVTKDDIWFFDAIQHRLENNIYIPKVSKSRPGGVFSK
jgi:hypothetical protein